MIFSNFHYVFRIALSPLHHVSIAQCLGVRGAEQSPYLAPQRDQVPITHYGKGRTPRRNKELVSQWNFPRSSNQICLPGEVSNA